MSTPKYFASASAAAICTCVRPNLSAAHCEAWTKVRNTRIRASCVSILSEGRSVPPDEGVWFGEYCQRCKGVREAASKAEANAVLWRRRSSTI
eukprot:2270156-Rhodomonas_salina.2